jgi:hypothetical protein
MESDIDHIAPVDPGEAEALLQLLELLLDETYVARNERQERVRRVVQLGAEKAAQKLGPLAPVAPKP